MCSTETYANLTAGEDVLTIGLNRAVDLIATKRAKGLGPVRPRRAAGKVLGEHPDGGEIQVLDGKVRRLRQMERRERDDPQDDGEGYRHGRAGP